MDFKNTWYIIERNQKFEIISHEDLMALEESTPYQMVQNYRSHHDAVMEMSRLVMQDISEVNAKINRLKKS
jgi:riboflavin biosynthesis pyrimidine reductase